MNKNSDINNNKQNDSSVNEKSNEKKIREISEILKLTTIVSNIGFTMVGCIITGFFIGLGIEIFVLKKFFHIKPNSITVLIFTLLGVGAGFVSVYKFINKKIFNFKVENKQDL